MSEFDVVFVRLCRLVHRRDLHLADHGIFQNVLDLCNGGVADLIVKAAGAAAIARYGAGAVGHIAHLAKTRQFGADGLAVVGVFRLLDELYLLAHLKRCGAETVVQAGQCHIILHDCFPP